MTVKLEIHPESPHKRKIDRAVEILHRGGVAAYPTDSVYALGCAIDSRKALTTLYRAKDLSPKQGLALMVPDLSAAAEYGRFTRGAYRLAKRIFPGPYVLIVPATSAVPRNLLDKKRREVGIRVPSHPITKALLDGLGRPLMTTTAQAPDGGDPFTDAEDVFEEFSSIIDVLIDGGMTGNESTTVLKVDSDDETQVEVLREGCGSLDGLWID